MHPWSGHGISRVNPSRREASSFQAANRSQPPKGAKNRPGMRFAFDGSNRPPLMKRISVIALLALVLLLLKPAIAQTPTSPKETDELNALISDVQAQQKEISENQMKIDEKLATLADTLREAKIFSSRGGH